MTDPTHRLVPGSARGPAPSAGTGRAIDPGEVVEVTVVLRRRAPVPDVLIEGPDTLSAAQLGAEYGAEGADVDVVRGVLGAAGLTVTSVDAPSRRMLVSGSAAAVAAVFGTTLTRTTSPDPVTGEAVGHRHRTGELTVPAVLEGVVMAVLGIDDRPQARAQFRIATPPPEAATPGAGTPGAGAPGAAAPGAGYTRPSSGRPTPFLPALMGPDRAWRSWSSAAATPNPTWMPTSRVWGWAPPRSARSASTVG